MKQRGYAWHSQQGSQTPDNRDFCGIAETQGTTLCVLVDGATSGPRGGELARALVVHLLKSFMHLEEPPSSDKIIELLEWAHADLRKGYPADSASYIMALFNGDPSVTTLHAGDCRLGQVLRDGAIRWLTKVHTLATAIEDLEDQELRPHPNRHLLTRAFKGKRFQTPECSSFDLQTVDGGLLLASDGFWADLGEDEQVMVLRGLPVERKPPCDDVSCLHWTIPGYQGRPMTLTTKRNLVGQPPQNLIIAPRKI